MNGINVGTSKVSTGYKGSQNTDYIILGQTTVDCDLYQNVNVGYGYIRNEGNYCIVAGMANPKYLSSLSDVNPGLSATYQFIFDGDIYEYIIQW